MNIILIMMSLTIPCNSFKYITLDTTKSKTAEINSKREYSIITFIVSLKRFLSFIPMFFQKIY